MVVAITGASSGIGRTTAHILSAQGHVVYDLSRTHKPQPGVEHISCDVTQRTMIEKAIEHIAQKSGRLDSLILCAGMGVAGSVEHTQESEMHRQFDVNTYGPVRVLQVALPLMRRTIQTSQSRVRPRIVFVSSMAAQFGIPFQAMYSATKAAINSFAFSLRNELEAQGIDVTVVMPGDVKTNFKRTTDLADADIYPLMPRAISQMERDEANGLSSEQVAHRVVKATLRRRPALFYTSDALSTLQCFLQRLLPTSIALRVVRKMYLGK